MDDVLNEAAPLKLKYLRVLERCPYERPQHKKTLPINERLWCVRRGLLEVHPEDKVSCRVTERGARLVELYTLAGWLPTQAERIEIATSALVNIVRGASMDGVSERYSHKRLNEIASEAYRKLTEAPPSRTPRRKSK